MPITPLELRPLRESDETTFRRAYPTWDSAQGFIFARGFDPARPFAEYIALTQDHFRGENLPEGFVPYTSLYAFVNDELVGMLTIRHLLNDFLLRIGGHIGYGVMPAHRRKGYAKEMLRLGLIEARRLGIPRALVTCDEGNLGSARTIERNGGVYENSTEQGAGHPPKRRYWINT